MSARTFDAGLGVCLRREYGYKMSRDRSAAGLSTLQSGEDTEIRSSTKSKFMYAWTEHGVDHDRMKFVSVSLTKS